MIRVPALTVESVDTGAASELINTFAATSIDDPSWTALWERVIEARLPLAERLARRDVGNGEPVDDLMQVAVLGLIKAVDRYKPGRGVYFARLRHSDGHRGDPAPLPRPHLVRPGTRRLQELRLEIAAANVKLTQTLGRSPIVWTR